MIAASIFAAAAVMSTSANMTVDGFFGFRAGAGGAWVDGNGVVDVEAGKEGSAIRFEATMGDDIMVRWVVVEPGHKYRVSPSACAGIAFQDLAKPKRRPFVQIDAHLLKDAAFPLKTIAFDGSELEKITWADIANAQEAQVDPKCPDGGARVRVVDATGKALVDEWIVVPNERVTRVILQLGGGFTAEAHDAFYIYFREDAARVDPVDVCGLRIVGHPYSLRHMHGGAGANAGMAVFEVTNGGTDPRTLRAKSAEMLRDFGTRPLKVAGLAFAEDASPYSPIGEQRESLTLAAGEKRFVRVFMESIELYRASINSTFRWSVVFECAGKTATATVPQEVMRVEPLRPRDD